MINMKTINVSDELHAQLKEASDFCGVSIQTLVIEMIERGFSEIMTTKEFMIEDINKLESYHQDINDYIRLKNLKEGEFRIKLLAELFKKPSIKIYHR